MTQPVQEPIQATDLNANLMSSKNKQGSKVVNPKTNQLSFGRIPSNNNGIPTGEIYLKLGFIGSGKMRTGAYGARHIWEKHKKDLNIESPEETPEVIANILKEGVDVLVNFEANHDPHRPVVLNTELGRVALSLYVEHGINAYSIVSAYGNKNAVGTVIGQLESPIINTPEN
ncbi:hypothetical protein RYY30_003402 [Vibrio cholerae]|uniref:ORF2 protein n=2 Tax=Vibrio cholerae TaxID=666 RepID=Q6TE20_VIBCL|nr:hypothetical protein [Vibrio cholerae]EGD5163556.1 hypothetical protein [Escherichia coli]AAQ97144.1 ORF2 protein [Vibrio cholerae]EGR0726757.1 hypothetical protein [Vibrio cholerae]EGR1330626.1 hypothetical protein [Vibrio cholerae]EGR2018089.1 hypothetical protein [Vibrio cholerae]